MRSIFYPHLVNGPFGDPALYVRIAHSRDALLFDCGELHELRPRELLKLKALFISHAHIDHLIGFDHLLRTYLYLDRQLLIYGPTGIIAQIHHRLGGYTWNLIEDYNLMVTVREWQAMELRECSFYACKRFEPGPISSRPCPDGVLHATGDWTVRAVPLAHGSIDSLAFRLEETLHVAIHKESLTAHGYLPGPWLTRFKALIRRGGPDACEVSVPLTEGGHRVLPLGELKQQIAHCEDGMKVVYVPDSSPTSENFRRIVALAENAHLLAIEATFADTDLERAQKRHHLTARISGELARAASATKLLVFHHSPRYQETPERLRMEADAAFEGRVP